MITIKDKKDCCGCTACYNACPKKAIAMQADQEGFLYPVIDQKKCVDCGICDATCPVINKVEKNPEQTEGYILRIKTIMFFLKVHLGEGSQLWQNMCCIMAV